MSAKIEARSSGKYHEKQSDDKFQRHNANRRHREGSGQDQFGQQAIGEDDGAVLYTVVCRKTQGSECYYRLRCVGPYGPRDGQWVNVKEVRHVKTTTGGENLFRLA